MKQIRPIAVINGGLNSSSLILEDWQPMSNLSLLKEKYENKLGQDCFLFFETRRKEMRKS